jgi:tungstate transport system ATP-binding protein
MTTQFKLHNIVKRYGNRTVLDIDQLVLEEGRIHTFIGPNGSGKSTLLRIMSLLLVNDEGELEVLGEKVRWEKEQLLHLRRQMSMVTQTAFMFQGSVNYNVAYGLRARKMKSRYIRERVDEMLEMAGMSAFKEADARTLSGGERQKVALARAMAINPKVLFLDEPTSNIDMASAFEIEKNIRTINREQGTTIILVTHNLFQARRLADEVIFIHEGKILESGNAESVFDDSRNEKTLAFLHGDTVL